MISDIEHEDFDVVSLLDKDDPYIWSYRDRAFPEHRSLKWIIAKRDMMKIFFEKKNSLKYCFLSIMRECTECSIK